MQLSDVILPLMGGVLIGFASILLLLFNGRIAGISGIVAEALRPGGSGLAWRWSFVGGLITGGLVLAAVNPAVFAELPMRSTPTLVFAGLLVGIGARLGSGCTSGHGVCGIGRFSVRGVVATLTFMATGAATVYTVHHVWGASL
ncbi:MAG: YeeE/YedE thiosulfate transporter family protein [Myxococcota bacterium]